MPGDGLRALIRQAAVNALSQALIPAGPAAGEVSPSNRAGSGNGFDHDGAEVTAPNGFSVS